MTDNSSQASEAITEYKALLRTYLDRRPSVEPLVLVMVVPACYVLPADRQQKQAQEHDR